MKTNEQLHSSIRDPVSHRLGSTCWWRTVCAAFVASLAVLTAAPTHAKPLYVITDLNNGSPIRSYEIQPAPIHLTFNQDSMPSRYGGVGIAIDTDSATLFVTYENSATLDVIQASTLSLLGQVTVLGAINLAGIAVDQHRSRVYVMQERGTNLFVYQWNAATLSLTLVEQVQLAGAMGAYGIAVDELQDQLFVADASSSMVRIYRTSDWAPVGQVALPQPPVAVAVDAKRHLVYTGNAGRMIGSLGLLSKYDLVSGVETTVSIPMITGETNDNVSGIAVDVDTGVVYITTKGDAFPNLEGSDRLMVFDLNLQNVFSTGDLGNPTGIAIPGKNDPPTLTCPGAATVECGSPVTLTASVSDPEGDAVGVVWSVDGVPVQTNMVPADPLHTTAMISLTYVFTSSGSHTVALIATDGYDSAECSSQVTVQPIAARIDIKPGSPVNPINLKANGRFTVALISAGTLEARSVRTSSIRFGDPRLSGRVSPVKRSYEDVNHDGRLDIVFHFSVPAVRMANALNGLSIRAELTGALNNGCTFRGEDTVRIIHPPKVTGFKP